MYHLPGTYGREADLDVATLLRKGDITDEITEQAISGVYKFGNAAIKSKEKAAKDAIARTNEHYAYQGEAKNDQQTLDQQFFDQQHVSTNF